MVKFGQVTAYDPLTGMADIAYVRPDACAKCGACGHLDQQGSIRLPVKAGCAVGSWVRVVFPDKKFIGAAALAYGLPLVCLLAGLAAGYALGGGVDVWTLLGSGIGLGVGALALKLCERRLAGRGEWAPYVDAVFAEKPGAVEIGCQK